MSAFGTFLLSLATPLARRVLIALGLGIVTYAGLTAVANQIRDNITSSYGALTGPVLDLLNLLGAGQAIGIIVGAVIARASLAAISRIESLS